MTAVTTPEVGQILPHTPEWREWRRQGIGGSDAAVITGDDPFRKPLTLWLDKSGYLDDAARDDDDDEPQYWGKRLESAVIERFERDTGLFVIQRQMCIEHHLDRWRRATIDGLVCESSTVPIPRVMPEKMRFVGSWAEVPGAPLGLFEGKTTSKTQEWAGDAPPVYVQIQVQHNLDVAEVDHAWVAVLVTTPVVHFKLFELERDEAITGPLRALEERFWRRVLEHDAPEPQSMDLEALKRAYSSPVADTIELETAQLMPTAREIIDDLVAARAQKLAAEHRVETAEAMLASLLREHETGTIDGEPAINWKRHERTYFDADALRAEHPAIAQQFTTKRSYRQFTIPKGGKHVDESR